MLETLGLSPGLLPLTLWKIGVAIACTVPCALLGCYLVLRRMSLLGDGISHGVLPGIVIAFMLTGQLTGWPVILGAMLFGLLTAIFSHWIHSVANVSEDASLGVVFTSLFALGVVLVSLFGKGTDLDVDCVLFGHLDLIPLYKVRVLGLLIPEVLPTMLTTLFATLLFISLLWKELRIASFDSELATSMGLNAGVINYLLMAMVAGVTVSAFEAVGSVLVIAMLIVPGATAQLLSDRLLPMLLWAGGVAILSSVLGVIIGGPGLVETNTPGMITVIAGSFFALAVFFAPQHGLVGRMLQNARLQFRIICEDILAALYRQEEAKRREESETIARLQQEITRASSGFMGGLAIRELKRQGQMVGSELEKYRLTEKGRNQAENVVRSHRLWEKYLDENFALPPDHLHEPATRMEHFIGPDLQQQIASELAQPDVDPHGRKIPEKKD